jgi:hypothetical protein
MPDILIPVHRILLCRHRPHIEAADPLTGIRGLYRTYIDFARSQPALYRLMFSKPGYSLHSEACRWAGLLLDGLVPEGFIGPQEDPIAFSQALLE